MIASINPATGETLRIFDPLTESQIEDRLRRAAAAYQTYRRTSFAERARWLSAAAEILESEKDRLGRIMTLEMGKPIGAARAEAAKCALACRYYAEHGERLLADEPVDARRRAQLHPVPAHRAGAGGDALEFSVLAGVPVRRSGADGGQRGAAETCVQRAAVRARNRGHHSPRGVSAGRVSDAADRLRAGGARDRRSARARR